MEFSHIVLLAIALGLLILNASSSPLPTSATPTQRPTSVNLISEEITTTNLTVAMLPSDAHVLEGEEVIVKCGVLIPFIYCNFIDEQGIVTTLSDKDSSLQASLVDEKMHIAAVDDENKTVCGMRISKARVEDTGLWKCELILNVLNKIKVLKGEAKIVVNKAQTDDTQVTKNVAAKMITNVVDEVKKISEEIVNSETGDVTKNVSNEKTKKIIVEVLETSTEGTERLTEELKIVNEEVMRSERIEETVIHPAKTGTQDNTDMMIVIAVIVILVIVIVIVITGRIWGIFCFAQRDTSKEDMAGQVQIVSGKGDGASESVEEIELKAKDFLRD